MPIGRPRLPPRLTGILRRADLDGTRHMVELFEGETPEAVARKFGAATGIDADNEAIIAKELARFAPRPPPSRRPTRRPPSPRPDSDVRNRTLASVGAEASGVLFSTNMVVNDIERVFEVMPLVARALSRRPPYSHLPPSSCLAPAVAPGRERPAGGTRLLRAPGHRRPAHQDGGRLRHRRVRKDCRALPACPGLAACGVVLPKLVLGTGQSGMGNCNGGAANPREPPKPAEATAGACVRCDLPPVRLAVNTMGGEPLKLELPADATVAALKQRICDQGSANVHPVLQQLYVEGIVRQRSAPRALAIPHVRCPHR